jgi:dihydrofolate reductase
LVATENITLDGVIEATDGWFAPAGDERSEVDNSDIENELRRQMDQQDGLLLGRVTFEEFRSYWPRQADDTTGITAHLNQIPKYVASRTLSNPGWANTTVLQGALLDEVQALKAEPGNDLGITGSITVVRDLVTARLVDEYRLFVYPVVLGHGERLFTGAANRSDLQLIDATPFRSGVVLLTYRPC